jgi:hypothetical protein
MDTTLKYCTRGKHHVLRSEFWVDAKSPDGLHHWCPTCHASSRMERMAIKSAEYAARNSWRAA